MEKTHVFKSWLTGATKEMKMPDQKEIILPLEGDKRYMNAQLICEKAAGLVSGAREQTHGDKVINHQNIADLWNAYLWGYDIDEESLLTPQDVAVMMCLLKIARTQEGGFNLDDFVDMAGYAGCAGEIAMRGQE